MIDWIRSERNSPRAEGGSTALQMVHHLPEHLDDQDPPERLQFNDLIHRALEQTRSNSKKSWQAFWRTTIDGLSVAQVAEVVNNSSHRSATSVEMLRRLRQQLGEQI